MNIEDEKWTIIESVQLKGRKYSRDINELDDCYEFLEGKEIEYLLVSFSIIHTSHTSLYSERMKRLKLMIFE